MSEKTQRHKGFAAAWTVLIVLGLIVAFLGRLLGDEENPTGIVLSMAPLFVGILSVSLLIVGYLMFVKSNTKTVAQSAAEGIAKDTTALRRNAMLVEILGVFMLAGHFIFKQVIPLMFG